MANRFENKVRILDTIRERRKVSRPLLAESLAINLPTISNLTKELLDEGLIHGDGFEKSEGGRRAELLTLNPGFATAIGLEMSLNGIRGIVADLGGRVLHRIEGPREIPRDADGAVKALLAVAEQLAAQGDEQRRPIGVGLSIAGLTGGGRVLREFPHREAWKDVPLADLVEQRLKLPALLENDVQAATLAERRHGSAREARNFLYLHIGHGIACGIVVEGKLYTGATGNAGEFGHTIVDPAGPICYCGNYGCLESLASPPALVDQTLQAIRKGVHSKVAEASGADLRAVDVEAVYRAAESGDRLAGNVVTKAGEYIGLGLANLANFFNPELIVFGGGVLIKAYSGFNETIERTFRSRVLPILQHQTRLTLSALGSDAAALGGSMMVFEDLFDRPQSLFDLAHGKRPEVRAARAARGASREANDGRRKERAGKAVRRGKRVHAGQA